MPNTLRIVHEDRISFMFRTNTGTDLRAIEDEQEDQRHARLVPISIPRIRWLERPEILPEVKGETMG